MFIVAVVYAVFKYFHPITIVVVNIGFSYFTDI